MSDFKSLGIRPELDRKLQASGLTEPTPVQEKTIPFALTGKDVIAQAQTGTGKTLAFVLPILEKIDPDQSHVQALIVTPTRELALQITTEVKKLAPAVGAQVLAVYGGQDVERQMKKLQGSRQIVIGTPGRLLDHLRRGTITLSRISTLVLDEADQMLHMGFLKEVEEIIRNTPAGRQTMLFSATISPQIKSLAARFMRQPEDVRVRGKQVTLEDIRQIAVMTSDRAKQDTLCTYIDRERPYLAMIFCRTKRRASTLNEALLERGYDSDELHGDLSQAKREQVMKRFRDAKLEILVATDVAARGLDVEGVTHVFNFDIPHDAESYIHRIGRTGRAGGEGIAITFVAPSDREFLETIERGIGQKIEREGGGARGRGDQTEEYVNNDEGPVDSGRSGRGAGRSAGRGEGRGTRERAGQGGRRGAGRGESSAGRGTGRSAGRGTGSGESRSAGRGEGRNVGRGTGSGEWRGSGQGAGRDSRELAGQGGGRGAGRQTAPRGGRPADRSAGRGAERAAERGFGGAGGDDRAARSGADRTARSAGASGRPGGKPAWPKASRGGRPDAPAGRRPEPGERRPRGKAAVSAASGASFGAASKAADGFGGSRTAPKGLGSRPASKAPSGLGSQRSAKSASDFGARTASKSAVGKGTRPAAKSAPRTGSEWGSRKPASAGVGGKKPRASSSGRNKAPGASGGPRKRQR